MLKLWVGQKVRLRAVQPDDVKLFAKYAEDSELNRLAGDTKFPYNPERDRRSLEKELDEDADKSDDAYLLIETLEGKFVGTIQLYHTDRRHRTAEFGLVLDNRKAWGKGYGSEAVRLLLRFVFRELGYEKVGLSAYEFNTRALALYEHLGFQHEARRRSAIYTDGRRWDELYMGMTRAEYDAQHAVWFDAASALDQDAPE
jgi:RimJ/RimL family protein N-acetyltransferase